MGGCTTYGTDGICIQSFGPKPNGEDHLDKRGTDRTVMEKCEELELDVFIVRVFCISNGTRTDHRDARSKARTIFAHSNTGVVGSTLGAWMFVPILCFCR
jgi:hypothetical protein